MADCFRLRRGARAAALLAVPALLAADVAPGAQGQDWPTRPVRVVVPTPPGGAVDGVARIVGARLSELLGQPVLIDNRPGASTTLGAEVASRSNADGYTLYINASVHAIAPHVIKVSYDPVRDFTPIAELARGPLLFTVHPSVPAKTVPEFVDAVRANPAKFSFATSANGAAGHIAIAMFRSRAKVPDVPIVVYKGSGPALADLIGGQTSAMIDPVLSASPHVKAGKLRALAITSARRSPLFPDLPTVVELGMPELEIYSWYGLWAPAGLAKPVLQRLEDAALKAVQTAEVRDKLLGLGFDATGQPASRFGEFVRTEWLKYRAIVKEAAIRAE